MERLISIVKLTLTEIEHKLTSRPLTYFSDENFCESLTPFHMNYGKPFNGRCEIDINGKVKGDDLCVQVKHTEMVYNIFKIVFIRNIS